jgi:hypothetical protein
MVIILISSVALLAVGAIGLYLFMRTLQPKSAALTPPPPPRGLFEEQEAARQIEEEKKARETAAAEHRLSLLERARTGEKAALEEAVQIKDSALYDQVLNVLLVAADSSAKLLSLASYVTRQEFPVNRKLAEAMMRVWQEDPDRSSTSKALHFAALSDDASLYQEAVQTALEFWRSGRLPDTSEQELRALFDGEFWLLSAKVRGSGAGFILKRTLSGARRELEAAMPAKQ